MLDDFVKAQENINKKYQELVNGTLAKRKSETDLEEEILSENNEDSTNKKIKLDETKSENVLNNKKLVCMHARYEK
jgi:hypothetical protein